MEIMYFRIVQYQRTNILYTRRTLVKVPHWLIKHANQSQLLFLSMLCCQQIIKRGWGVRAPKWQTVFFVLVRRLGQLPKT